MASEIEIANSALRKVGADTITSFDQGSPSANFMDDRFDETRNELLRLHYWNFATKRAQLARESTAPAFEYTYFYTRPSDWVRTVRAFDNDAGTGHFDYREENGKIACNSEQVFLAYIYLCEDPNAMTADFREALAWRLALDVAPSLANSAGMFDRMQMGFEAALMAAKSADALANRSRGLPRGSWVTSRSRSQASWPE